MTTAVQISQANAVQKLAKKSGRAVCQRDVVQQQQMAPSFEQMHGHRMAEIRQTGGGPRVAVLVL